MKNMEIYALFCGCSLIRSYYFYDEAGQLIGEYTKEGKKAQETVYLYDMPVAILEKKHLYFITPDRLNYRHLSSNRP